MSPTVFREDGFRFYFFSREESRMHVHVQCADGEAKFWLEPIAVAFRTGYADHEIRRIESLVAQNLEVLLDAWKRVHDR